MSASTPRVDGFAVRAAMVAFPRRFRASLATDLVALYEDFDRNGRGVGRRAVVWNIARNGVAARFDDLRRALGGGGPRGSAISPEPRGGLGTLGQDFLFALRIMRKSPVFTALAVGSLAIGIGANTAAFTLLDATILRELPVRAPQELTVLHVLAPFDEWPDVSTNGWILDTDDGRGEGSSVSYSHYERIRDSATPLQSVTTFAPIYRINVGFGDGTELASGQVVAGNYYDFLGIQPALGRLLVPSDDDLASPPAAVVSWAYWQTRFGGHDDVIGNEVRLNGNAFTLVGVSPRGFAGALQVGMSPDITVPLAHHSLVMRGRELLSQPDYWWLRVMGRLQPGATLEQAEAAMAAILARTLADDLQDTDSPLTARLLPGARGMTEARSLIVRPMGILLAVVVAVLLIACVNLANLLLARASSRGREIALRMSIGASRRRVVRQLLSESILLSGSGAMLGTLLAFGLRGILAQALDLSAGSELGLALNWRVLGFTAFAAVATGLLFGIMPALRATGLNLTPALKDEAPRAVGRRLNLGRALLVVQMGLSLLLLVVAGLFTGTLVQLNGEARGFDGDHVLVVGVDPRIAGYEGEGLVGFYEGALAELSRIPGVSAAGLAAHAPVSGSMSGMSIEVEGYEPEEGQSVGAFLNLVDHGFFAAFAITPRMGRVFESGDRAGTTPVAVVNQSLIDRYLPGTNPLGRKIIGAPSNPERAFEVEIVGVIDDIKYQNLRDNSSPALHVLYTQQAVRAGAFTFVLRAAREPEELANAARDAIRRLDPDVPVTSLGTQAEMQRLNVAVERAFAQLSAALSGVALLLSCIGLYGILSYSAARRTREIGVRMALGAGAADVIRLVMREMRTVGFGALVGLAGAYFAVRGLESSLYGLDPADPLIMLGAAATLIVVAAAAAFLPARQAAALDPVDALRNE